jgi:hypothetical protein
MWDENGDVVVSNDFSENARNHTTPFDVVAEAELGCSLPIGVPRLGAGTRFLSGIGVGYGLLNHYDPLDDEDEDSAYNSLIVRLFAGMTF